MVQLFSLSKGVEKRCGANKGLAKPVAIFGLVVLIETVVLVILLINSFLSTKDKLSLRLQLKQLNQELQTKTEQAASLLKEMEDTRETNQDLLTKLDNLLALQKKLQDNLQALQNQTQNTVQASKDSAQTLLSQIQEMYSKDAGLQQEILNRLDQLAGMKDLIEQRLSAAPLGPPLTNTNGGPDVNLGTINVNSPPEEKKPAAPQGEVLSVDNRFGFVILDLGEKNDTKPGDCFLVFRGGVKIGEVKVKKVFPTMSLADIVQEKTTRTLRRNDTVCSNP